VIVASRRLAYAGLTKEERRLSRYFRAIGQGVLVDNMQIDR
jgi:hypothetical protein